MRKKYIPFLCYPRDLDSRFFARRLGTCCLVDFTSSKKLPKSLKGCFFFFNLSSSCHFFDHHRMAFMLWEGLVCVALPGVDGRQWKQLVGSVFYFTKNNYLDFMFIHQLFSILFGWMYEIEAGPSWTSPDWEACFTVFGSKFRSK